VLLDIDRVLSLSEILSAAETTAEAAVATPVEPLELAEMVE